MQSVEVPKSKTLVKKKRETPEINYDEMTTEQKKQLILDKLAENQYERTFASKEEKRRG